jgi:hypothetical protein
MSGSEGNKEWQSKIRIPITKSEFQIAVCILHFRFLFSKLHFPFRFFLCGFDIVASMTQGL